MPIRLGVIADDLTGANDTGVQFARKGARTIVPLEWHDLASLERGADVLVLCTDSRALPKEVAAQRARVAAQALRKARAETIYKKIDSTFRGNIGAELEAILEVFPATLAVLTPTFPPARRAVEDGILTVEGTPVHRTSIGRDPVTPVRESHLPTLLRRQLRRPVYHLGLPLLRSPAARAAATLRTWREGAAGVILADSVSAEDLRRLARLILDERLLPVVAGSAGLAEALSAVLPWRRRSRQRPAGTRDPVLAVVGSPNPVSQEQVAWLERRGQTAVIRATIREIVAGRDRFRRELSRVMGKVLSEIAAGRDTALTLAQLARTGGRRSLPPSASGTLSEFLGQAAQQVTSRAAVGGLILCGGDIANETCRALGARGIELLGEVEPGVPWGRLVDGKSCNLLVVTKAGGFGQPPTFARAMRFLHLGRASGRP
jgi:uncharacterized protein YgbK (DUF1537 family)